MSECPICGGDERDGCTCEALAREDAQYDALWELGLQLGDELDGKLNAAEPPMEEIREHIRRRIAEEREAKRIPAVPIECLITVPDWANGKKVVWLIEANEKK